jgi:hypothetical protein
MAAASTTLTKLGPFDIATLSREVVADVVINQRAPMIARQVIDGMPRYAIISNRDNLKLVCVGCFKEGMTLADDSRCRTCTSFVKHWTTKDGIRNWKCKPTEETIEEVAKTCPEVELDFGGGGVDAWTTDDLVMELKRRNAIEEALKAVTDDDILGELKKRELTDCVIEDASEEDLAKVMRSKGLKPLFDARRVELIHELRRQEYNATVESYYHNNKKRAQPHASDEVGIDIVEKSEDVLRETRENKKGKWHRKVIEPMALYCSD